MATLSKAEDEEKRQQVLDLVNLHYEKCEIEPLSFSTLCSSNFMMKMMMPKKINSAIARYQIDFTKFLGLIGHFVLCKKEKDLKITSY